VLGLVKDHKFLKVLLEREPIVVSHIKALKMTKC